MALESIKNRITAKKAEIAEMWQNDDMDNPDIQAKYQNLLKELLALYSLRTKHGSMNQEVEEKDVTERVNALNREGRLDSFMEETGADKLDKMDKLHEMVETDKLVAEFKEHRREKKISVSDREDRKKAELQELQDNHDMDEKAKEQQIKELMKDIIALSYLKAKSGGDEKITDKQFKVQRRSLNDDNQLNSFFKQKTMAELQGLMDEGKLAASFAEHFQKDAGKEKNKWFKDEQFKPDPKEERQTEIFLRGVNKAIRDMKENNMADGPVKSMENVRKQTKAAAAGDKYQAALKVNNLIAARLEMMKCLHQYAPDNGDESKLSSEKKKKVALVKQNITLLDNELIRMGAISADYNPTYKYADDGKEFQYADMENRIKGSNEYHPMMFISENERRENRRFQDKITDLCRSMGQAWIKSNEFNNMLKSAEQLEVYTKNFNSDESGSADMTLWSSKVTTMLKAREEAVKYTVKKRLEAGLTPDSEKWDDYIPSGSKSRKRYNNAVSLVETIDEELARMGVYKSGSVLNYKIAHNGKTIDYATKTYAAKDYDEPSASAQDNLTLSGKVIKQPEEEGIALVDAKTKSIQQELSDVVGEGKKPDKATIMKYASKLIANERTKKDILEGKILNKDKINQEINKREKSLQDDPVLNKFVNIIIVEKKDRNFVDIMKQDASRVNELYGKWYKNGVIDIKPQANAEANAEANAQNNNIQQNGPDIKNNRLKVINEIILRTDGGAHPEKINVDEVDILFTKFVYADMFDRTNERYHTQSSIDGLDNNTLQRSLPGSSIQQFLTKEKQGVSPQDYIKKMCDSMLQDGGTNILAKYMQETDRSRNQQIINQQRQLQMRNQMQNVIIPGGMAPAPAVL